MAFVQSSLRLSSTLRTSVASFQSTSSCSFPLRPLAAFHTSAQLSAESTRERAARLTRKRNLQGKEERARKQRETRPHVVLGTRPGDESKWANCDLAKVMLTPEEIISSSAEDAAVDADSFAPRYLGYGADGAGIADIREDNEAFLFHDLKEASAKYELSDEVQDEIIRSGVGISGAVNIYNRLKNSELRKTKNFARVMDLRNANARGIAFENRRRVIAAFSPPGKDNDTGYSEVQIALITMKIRNVWSHLVRCKKDIPGRRALRLLIHQRAKMLKYLKGVDRDRYDRILERVALEPESIEGELVV